MLAKPWEISCKGSRGPNEKIKTFRPTTTIDLECFPCYLSFSEQFLINLAAANRMWAIYSKATQSSELNDSESAKSSLLRKSLAASAVRKFVAVLPYAIENHTGVPITFSIGDDNSSLRLRIRIEGIFQV